MALSGSCDRCFNRDFEKIRIFQKTRLRFMIILITIFMAHRRSARLSPPSAVPGIPMRHFIGCTSSPSEPTSSVCIVPGIGFHEPFFLLALLRGGCYIHYNASRFCPSVPPLSGARKLGALLIFCPLPKSFHSCLPRFGPRFPPPDFFGNCGLHLILAGATYITTHRGSARLSPPSAVPGSSVRYFFSAPVLHPPLFCLPPPESTFQGFFYRRVSIACARFTKYSLVPGPHSCGISIGRQWPVGHVRHVSRCSS